MRGARVVKNPHTNLIMTEWKVLSFAIYHILYLIVSLNASKITIKIIFKIIRMDFHCIRVYYEDLKYSYIIQIQIYYHKYCKIFSANTGELVLLNVPFLILSVRMVGPLTEFIILDPLPLPTLNNNHDIVETLNNFRY